jgi:methyltransferase
MGVNTNMLFAFFYTYLVVQRIIELMIAKRNEKWILEKGGYEAGREHYKWIVAVHILFFVSLLLEVQFFQKHLTPFWPFLLPIFIILQILRVWVIVSLGKFWNTKIMILPNAEGVAKGPYRIMRHPNYVVVTAEILIIPLLFEAYITAVVFTILNLAVLSIRIPEEERALMNNTYYQKQFAMVPRFFPKNIKK